MSRFSSRAKSRHQTQRDATGLPAASMIPIPRENDLPHDSQTLFE